MAANLTERPTATVVAPVRHGILQFEKALAKLPHAFFGDSEQCPLRHSFAPGIYIREITIPASTFIVGKIHKHMHCNMLMAGEVIVYTESTGWQHLIAPQVLMSAAGTKRVLYTLSEVWWATIHHNPTNTTDLGQLEDAIIATDYATFDAGIAGGIL